MAGYEQTIIVGNLGGDPEMRYLQSGVAVCNFSVAVNTVAGSGENRTEKVKWYRVAAWRDLGETCNKYLTKGQQVMVIGVVDSHAYTDNGGKPQSTLELTARDVRFLGGGVHAENDAGAHMEHSNDIPF